MPKIHPLADVQSDRIGAGTQIWQFVVVLKEARIGENCNINCQVFIENDVVIGDHVTIKPGVQIWDGMYIGDHVFIGPNATFTNDLIPRSKQYPTSFPKTFIGEGASLGANSTVLPGISIGKYAMLGAGSVLTKDIPNNEVWIGNPAKFHGFITKEGTLLSKQLKDSEGQTYCWRNGEIEKE